MLPATFKDLCIDVVDEERMTAFWAAALGLEPRTHEDGDVQLVGPTPQHGVWVNQVPEARTVKQRVHLDVHAPSVTEYESMGARVLPGWGPFGWTVMADPEGGELCVFERDEVPAYRLYELGVDSADPAGIAQWWGDVLGAHAGREEQCAYIDQVPGMPFESIVFAPVPEPKSVKNRIHWDIGVGDQDDLDALQAHGATVLRPADDEIGWTVMADPEGNEFCVHLG
ncbi:MAG: VOC family protein [Nocardioidaceae bacterium]